MVLKMPAIVGETQLSSLQHVVCNFPDGYCSEGLYTLNQTLNAFKLLPVHVILCFSPEVEVQRVQIRRMRWPIDWRSPTDYPTIELLEKDVHGQSGAMRRRTILHPPIPFSCSLGSQCWPHHILQHTQVASSIG